MAKLNDLFPAVSGTWPPQVDPVPMVINQNTVDAIGDLVGC